MSGLAGQRRAGVLLHLTSLPGPGPRGTLGADACRFVDFLSASGFSVWQILPVGLPDAYDSPYQSISAHAGDPALITPDAFPATARDSLPVQAEYAEFRAQHAHWLEDYALFKSLQEQFGCAWYRWPEPLRLRSSAALTDARADLHDRIAHLCFEQYAFAAQWRELKRYANAKGVLLFGDMPLFVSLDSAEVWARRELFSVDADGQPQVVAGVPPDYFSATGQRWGYPLYRWKQHEESGFAWWIDRIRTQFERFDLLRIDHFRGLESYWEIPAESDTALQGRWVPAPGAALLQRIREVFGDLPLIAEDLGYITPEVIALRDRFSLPGMNVLQFAFSGDPQNPYLPHHQRENSVTYTGTHDNDTSLGWFDSLNRETRDRVLDCLGHPTDPMPRPMVVAALASVAKLAIIPMQDLLGLGSQARMNRPGISDGNWRWRFDWRQIAPDLASDLLRLNTLYGRTSR